MTLFRQIQLLITLILITMLAAVLKINFDNTKEFVRTQMYNNAKNTANSLSLSISPFVNDEGMMTTMINAMYDGGYYEEITLKNFEGKIVYQAKQVPKIEGVPQKFVEMAHLDTPAAEAQIPNGWVIYGTLTVKGHPGLAYIQLWDTFKNLCISFAVIAAIAIAVSYVMLKLLLSALNKIRRQAEAIDNNEFIINEKIPRTPELKKVVTAMNQMVGKVQTIFNRELETLKNYQELLYKDQLTGLYNRKFFITKLTEYIESEEANSNGEVMLFFVEGIDEAIAEIGHPAMRSVYNGISSLLSGSFASAGMVPACFNKDEFAVLLPSVTEEDAMQKLNDFISKADALFKSDPKTAPFLKLYAGAASYTYEENMAKIMSKADYALSVAKSSETINFNHFNDKANQKVLGKLEWKNMIEAALSENRFILTSQAVKSTEGELHQEIFVNLVDENGNVQRAGYFMPMVVNLNLANSLDRYVLEKSVQYLAQNTGSTLAINITDIFLNDRASFTWFRKLLLASKDLKDRITFEISDNAINSNPDICLDFSGLIKGLGFTFGVDRFAMSSTSLENLQKLKPNYIKIDYDYLLGSEDSHTAINSLQTITESLGIKLIATKVENDELKNSLATKNIVYFQGRGIADISPLGKK